MSKGLEALERVKEGFELLPSELETIEKELETLETIKKQGIILVIPDNDFTSEHIDIQIYKKHFSKEKWEALKEALYA